MDVRETSREHLAVYEQIKELQTGCEVRVESRCEDGGRLRWRIVVTPRDRPQDVISGESEDLVEAARIVVGRAVVSGLLHDGTA